MKEQALFSPDTLLEDSPSELINQIGDANFTRTEGRVNIWRYGLGVCITDFFLYPDPLRHLMVKLLLGFRSTSS